MLYQNSRGQTIGGLSSMATSITISRAPAHAFQFRLATLLIATVWAALVSLGLRTPSPFWSGVVAVLTLLVVMFAVLLVIYRIGRTRAMAIGFLVFCVGYLIYLACWNTERRPEFQLNTCWWRFSKRVSEHPPADYGTSWRFWWCNG